MYIYVYERMYIYVYERMYIYVYERMSKESKAKITSWASANPKPGEMGRGQGTGEIFAAMWGSASCFLIAPTLSGRTRCVGIDGQPMTPMTLLE